MEQTNEAGQAQPSAYDRMVRAILAESTKRRGEESSASPVPAKNTALPDDSDCDGISPA